MTPLLFQANLILSVIAYSDAVECPNSFSSNKSKPLYLLALVPFPDATNGAGWSNGLGTLPGAIVARDEINNRTDLLPDHHIELIVENIEACSRTEAGIGFTNLVKHTVNPQCGPVTALIGLFCSSHTALVSPLAGHDGLDMIQLAAANSPVFELQNDAFPHLWLFLALGTIYVDTTLALMDHFNWTRIGIVYDSESIYFTDIATLLEKHVIAANKTVLFIYSFNKLNEFLINQVITEIKNKAATILFAVINDHQATELLCQLDQNALTYPGYIWIQVGKRLNRILSVNESCSQEELITAKNGHIHLDINLRPSNENELLVSGEMYASYKSKYEAALNQIRNEYNTTIKPTNYSNFMYDQVWAFALAMNHSLPALEKRNLSIDNYTIGQPEITQVIEEEMSKLVFQGTSGIIKFGKQNFISGIVDIYQVFNTEILSGSYIHQTNSSFNLSLNISRKRVPKGDNPLVEDVMIPDYVAIVIFILSVLSVLFTTGILCMLLRYREWNEVKATSPFLSLCMISGFYLIVVAVVCRTVYGSSFWPDRIYRYLLCAESICEISGLTLVVVTVLFKVLRIYYIFSYMNLEKRFIFRSWFLVFVILLLSLWLSVVYIIVEIISPSKPSYQEDRMLIKNKIVRNRQLSYENNFMHLPGILLTFILPAYLTIFFTFIVYFSILTRKIDRKNFKDTKKTNLAVVIIIIIIVLNSIIKTIPYIFDQNNQWISNVVRSFLALLLTVSVSSILFLPKVIPSMFKPKPKRRTSKLSQRRSSANSLSVLSKKHSWLN